MKKNKNIFSHIIEEDYKKKRYEQNRCFEVSGKAFSLSEPLNENGSLVKQLEKLHEPLVVIEQPILDEPNQTRQQNSNELTNSFDDLELNEFSQKIEAEEQKKRSILMKAFSSYKLTYSMSIKTYNRGYKFILKKNGKL